MQMSKRKLNRLRKEYLKTSARHFENVEKMIDAMCHALQAVTHDDIRAYDEALAKLDQVKCFADQLADTDKE